MMMGSLAYARERHLVAKTLCLGFAGRVIVEIVEADFAPGDDFGMGGERGELIEMLGRDSLAS